MKVSVMVGSGVLVPRGKGVDVSVGVDVGSAAAVCVDAAPAVSTIIWLIAFGFNVGTAGAAESTGAQARITPSATDHIKYLYPRFNMMIWLCLPVITPQ